MAKISCGCLRVFDLGFNQLHYLDIYFLLVSKADLLEHYLDQCLYLAYNLMSVYC